MNLFEKLMNIENDLSNVAKNLTVGEGKSSYKAVGEADVLAAVKPLEFKYRVYSYPLSRTVIDHDLITTTKTYKDKSGGEQVTESTKLYMRVETVYRFVDVDKPDDYIDITTYGDGIDSGDKAPGKAMTYGDKYALLKAYKIITGDDPDQNASEETKIERGKPVENLKKSSYEPVPNVISADQRKFMISEAQRIYGDKTIGNKELVAWIRKEGFNDAHSITTDAYDNIMKNLKAVEESMKRDADALAGQDSDDAIGQMGLPFK